MKRNSFLLRAMAVAVVLTLVPAAVAAPKYKYKALHTFTGGADGGQPSSSLALDGSGNAYGMTWVGGSENGCPYQQGCGVIFELSPQADGRWKETALFDFTKDTGGSGYFVGLLFDGAGNLFGSTAGLVPGGNAYVFRLTPGGSGWQFNPIYDDGGLCLVFDKVGNLYGCIPPGGIAELSSGPNGWVYTDLYDFCQPPDYCYDGDEAVEPLTWDAVGNLYGTTLYGGNGQGTNCPGSAGCGVAFQLTPNGDGTWTYHVLWRFASSASDGYYPEAGLVVDAAGNAYGTTWGGGQYDNGTFYKLTPTKKGLWKETILYGFSNCSNGCGPYESFVPDQAGNLYGTAAGGNDCYSYGCGVIYKFTAQKNGQWKYSVVHKFSSAGAYAPYGVTLDSKGNIFGATYEGGKYNMGVAFEITP